MRVIDVSYVGKNEHEEIHAMWGDFLDEVKDAMRINYRMH